MSYKIIKVILQGLLLAVIAVIPFIKINTLYFPFVSGKVYFFRLLVCLAIFFFTWLILKDKQAGKSWQEIFLPFKNILVAGLILFFLAQFVVAFFAVDPTLSFFSTIERHDGVIQYGFWVLYFLMLIYTFREKKDWKILFFVFIITAFIVSCYSWFNLANQGRLAGIFGNPSYLAAYLIFSIGFCLIAFERKYFNKLFFNTLLLVATGFFTITLIFTQTRGVYLGVAGAVFLFCFLALLFLRKENKKIALICGIILVLGIFSAGGLFITKDNNFVKNNFFTGRIVEVFNFLEVGSIRERVLTWQIALQAFAEKPLVGYGPENFMVAFNKYYDFRIGKGDPWFDRAHNQPIEYLATGGIVLFASYLFFLVSVFYVIFKISKKQKILSFILASVFLAYIIQGLFLFDTLPIYLGLFPFLAFVVYLLQSLKNDDLSVKEVQKNSGNLPQKWHKTILVIVGLVCFAGTYTTVFMPYKANASALNFLGYTDQGYYVEAAPFAIDAFKSKSPYTQWEVRKRIGWQMLSILEKENQLSQNEIKEEISQLYDLVVPELERFITKRPFDPQMYFVLPRVYRLGFEKLGKDDLGKASLLLQESLKYSDLRLEYYNEMARIFLLQGDFEEGEKILKDYLKRVKSFDYFPNLTMGHYYYVAGKYDLAIENYKKAKAENYSFLDDDSEYSRYIDAAQNVGSYQEIVDMSLEYLDAKGPSDDIYFNVALGYYYLGEAEKAKEFFLKTLELNKEQYQQYASFFGL